MSDRFPDFDRVLPDDGYAWWYVDAISEDGSEALTLIAFLGSVFSPYYARARTRGPADPLNHCALNIAVYGRRGKRWAMTERPRSAVSRTPDSLRIGPSSVRWDGRSLYVDIDEWTVPTPSRIRGQVRVTPSALTDQEFVLDQHGYHIWRPVAPCSRIEVSLTHPVRQWSGHAYFDANFGTRPLELDFDEWEWCRASQPGGTLILYDGALRPSGTFSLALHATPGGNIEPLVPPAVVGLPSTRWWRMVRRTRADSGQASVLSTLEDTPFYSRSLLSKTLLQQPVTMIHESLSMHRFRSAWVPWLLPFRMPRLPYRAPSERH